MKSLSIFVVSSCSVVQSVMFSVGKYSFSSDQVTILLRSSRGLSYVPHEICTKQPDLGRNMVYPLLSNNSSYSFSIPCPRRCILDEQHLPKGEAQLEETVPKCCSLFRNRHHICKQTERRPQRNTRFKSLSVKPDRAFLWEPTRALTLPL